MNRARRALCGVVTTIASCKKTASVGPIRCRPGDLAVCHHDAFALAIGPPPIAGEIVWANWDVADFMFAIRPMGLKWPAGMTHVDGPQAPIHDLRLKPSFRPASISLARLGGLGRFERFKTALPADAPSEFLINEGCSPWMPKPREVGPHFADFNQGFAQNTSSIRATTWPNDNCQNYPPARCPR